MEEHPVTVRLCDEVVGAEFGDRRLNRRLVKIVEELGASPPLGIPAATERRAEMEAAYRFFDNDKVSPEKILQPHIDATMERIAQCDLVLLVQDTTELDLTRPTQQVRGAGPMDCEARRGAFVHPLIAFNEAGVPLGTVWQKTWARETIETSLSAAQKNRRRQETPIEQKESLRWIEGLRAARDVAAACPQTTCVCVSDSESDIYELFSEPRANSVRSADAAFDTGDGPSRTPAVHLLIRAGQTRSTETGNWLKNARAGKCLFQSTLQVSARRAKIKATKHRREQSREARVAEVEARATTVTLQPPYRFDRKLPPVVVNVILVEEPRPPAGCEPIQWLLVTTLPIDTLQQVKKIVEAYCLRWQIEIYFRTLKSGCRVEQRQFETLPRSLNCLAVYAIIAWRVMYLCRLGRECPDLDCEVVFSPSEWQSVYAVVHHGELPQQQPRLNEMIRMIASLGGYVPRQQTEPGPQTLWTGLQRMHCFSLAWDAFGPDTHINYLE